MGISTIIIYGFFLLIGMILFLNVIKIFSNIFSRPKSLVQSEITETPEVEEDPLVSELRLNIDEQVRPHLTSLEGMHNKTNASQDTLSSFVFSVFEDKLSDYVQKDKKMVEEEIAKCCSAYEGAECKESFCLEGSGISCPQT
ncbi:MAG: Unknown protein [uncultured Sulfurovum sp.]|uniref:Uncharacterized protein n=1 Tax=uncultured Sulfurovum sp. TaxID=269237 RepID=A0A6S6S8L3_9BACT|nr:MAG: Unknown protein [uncultured Sulfurovum sp.]